jgi:hypothetical protein
MRVHEIRAIFDEHTVRVYQAYPVAIADAAIKAGTFVAPFSLDRMTWIKPSFNWMMYRCGFASKPRQERVLAIDMTCSGFEWALAHAARSSHSSARHLTAAEWRRELESYPVRVQWDPERDRWLDIVPGVRSIQIGLSGEAVRRYVEEWIVRFEDVTPLAVAAGKSAAARVQVALPCDLERAYPVPQELMHICAA